LAFRSASVALELVELVLDLRERGRQILEGVEPRSHRNEGAGDGDAHLGRLRTPQHARDLDRALLGKGVGTVSAATAAL
jgi:hypothetical protein